LKVKDSSSVVVKTALWLRPIRTDNANKLILQSDRILDGCVDALGESGGIGGIPCAGDDALMRLTPPVKALEVAMIVGQYGPRLIDRISEELRIADSFPGLTRILHCFDIVSSAAQLFHNRQRKILIRIEPCHRRLVRLVSANVLINFVGMSAVVVPGCLQVTRRETADAIQQLLIGRAKLA
jgi:hypothetical protein